MEKAGSDPEAAVTLQKMFVKLEKERDTSRTDGLFNNTPPRKKG
jgi:hypothetical protein